MLFTADKSYRDTIEPIGKMLGVNLTKIGVIVSRRSIEIFDKNGDEYFIQNNGYTHF